MALPNPSMSFTPFDILTAEEMNDLVENINSLADGTGFNAGAIGTSDIADGAITAAKIDATSVGAYKVLGRTTLGVAGDTISVNPIVATKYLRIIIAVTATGGTIDTGIRFNNDSGNNYAQASFYNNAGTPAMDLSAGTGVALFTVEAFTGVSGSMTYAVVDVANFSTHAKKIVLDAVSEQTLGAGTPPTPYKLSGKWVNNAQVTRIDVINQGTGDFAIGSEVIVLGYN